MLSTNKSCISTKLSDWTLFTIVCGNGLQASESIRSDIVEEVGSVISAACEGAVVSASAMTIAGILEILALNDK